MFGFELELTRDMFISQLLPDWSWSMSVLIKDLITMQSDYMFGIFTILSTFCLLEAVELLLDV